jgi:acetolactate synthase-1/2/3 large subunit
MEWLRAAGYTHCFFVAGGNIMHLLNAARTRFTCVPFVHEVAAGIAAEYFNESGGQGRAFALVTAGPGLTNIVTAVAGAFLESRELLVVGGQVKSSDIATNGIRQRGIQEIDGVSIVAPISVNATRMETPLTHGEFMRLVDAGREGRPGPVFIEVCLDVQGAPLDERLLRDESRSSANGARFDDVEAAAASIAERMAKAERPMWLIGGGVSRETARALAARLRGLGVPLMTTWNGADRVAASEPLYFGRPNTWGMRYPNILIQQADLIVAFGTRLGLQQTGFNWQRFGENAYVVQIDVDRAELDKGHPKVDLKVCADANAVLRSLAGRAYPDYSAWISFCDEVKALLPLSEAANETAPGYVSPYEFYIGLSEVAGDDDVLIPCSSGGANFVGLQTIAQREGQIVITDKGLASMGYGLAGAIGAALAHPDRRVVVVEGDGGFIQNLQELATVAVNKLNLKVFLFANEGYASIRSTQRNYFGGAYIGCDTKTGLGFPEWPKLFDAFGIPLMELDEHWRESAGFARAFASGGPYGFVVPIDPEQTYFPKITSRITETGSMESNPLHLMSPDLPEEIAAKVYRYIGEQPAARAPR